MHPLNLTKLAFGCDSLDALHTRWARRRATGETWISTRYRPTRHEELIGGSLYFIVKHQLVARLPILGFGEEEGGRCRILLDPHLVPIRPRPKRAHQGWRYLKGEDAPADLAGDDDDLDEMPLPLASELSALGLI